MKTITDWFINICFGVSILLILNHAGRCEDYLYRLCWDIGGLCFVDLYAFWKYKIRNNK